MEPGTRAIIDWIGAEHLPHSLNTADAQRLEVEWGGREMVFSLLNKS